MRPEEVIRAAQAGAMQQAGIQATRVHVAVSIYQHMLLCGPYDWDRDELAPPRLGADLVPIAVARADELLRALGLTR